jgi:Uma2 family endonuclease
MPQPSAIWTAAKVRALPADGKRYELVDGALLVTPSPSWVHQIAVFELSRLLDGYARPNAIGRVLFAPADISLGEDEVLQPDVFVVPAALNPRSWQDVRALLLVIEVLSPGTARYDRLVKRRRYQRAPVPEYWIVDLDARLVERWRPDDTRPEILTETLEWKPVPGLAPLVIELPGLFAEAWGEKG